MKKALRSVVWFKEVDKDSISIVGGKGANLGELTAADISVPPGFIVTAQSYFYFIEITHLEGKIRSKLDNLDTGDSKRLQNVAAEIKEMISSSPMPPEVASEIKKAYKIMEGGPVAVRSSATAEDLPEASFAGQQRTYLNVEGCNQVVAAVQGCWASLFEPRAIFYREQQGFDHFSVGIAVPVQRMVQSNTSGVIFTTDPLSNDHNKIAIEAAYGLGETVVSGEVTPDFYIVDKAKMNILEKKIAKQEWRLVRNLAIRNNGDDFNIREPVPQTQQDQQKLTNEDIVELARLAKHIEEVYQFPQDIEWAKEDNTFYVVQSRPITTLNKGQQQETPLVGNVIIAGLAASPGAAAGPVKIVHDPSHIDMVEKGDILVAKMTTPDFVPAMKRAVAIATDHGGRTCHAAIVSRELGIPCVVGTEKATQILQPAQVITVDGTEGKIYEGAIARQPAPAPVISKERIQTKTKVYVNLAEPDLAEVIAARHVDGVGLARAEFMIAHIGEHPRYMISDNRGEQFTDRLARGLETFAQAFTPRPVVYRTTDFKTNEYRNLKGGEAFEGEEENPMIGYRGCSRYVIDRDVFKLETQAIKKVRESYDNLWIMIPFVRTIQELAAVKELLQEEGLRQSESFRLWMMVEIPSNIILLDRFITEVGIDGISIGSNDLTQLILGIDRDNGKLATQFDERDDAVMWAIQKAVTTSVKHGITCSICGQAPSVYPELTEKLVRWGITSVSVSPDMIEQTREIIGNAEKKALR